MQLRSTKKLSTVDAGLCLLPDFSFSARNQTADVCAMRVEYQQRQERE
jgi:hypothetical protein